MSWPIGKTYDAGVHTVEPEHALAYAAATGDDSAAYTGDAPIAPPMFHVRLMHGLLFQIATDPELELDMLRLVHGEHAATFERPLRPGDSVHVHGELLQVVEKASGLLVISGLYADVDGARAVTCKTAYFIRAKSTGAKPAKSPRPAAPAPPAPDFEREVAVPDDASIVYAAASLDDNPIHIDPAVAKRAGLPDVILQGLCTMAFTLREATAHAAGGDATKLAAGSVRFARPVLNGSALMVQGWATDDGAWALQTLGPDGKPVITNATARFH
jgi:acyl dehydratase